MFKKLVTYFLLLNFLNTIFFCNNDREGHDVFTNKEVIQEEEINSIVEYVVEECLDIKDATPEDEDDDYEDFFKIEKTDKCFSPTLAFENDSIIIYHDVITYSFYYNSTFNKVFLEIKSPPPRVV